MKAVIQSYDQYMEYMANFARHDVGNAIQNISAILKNVEDLIQPDLLASLRESVYHLNSTLENLGHIIPENGVKSFTLQKLFKNLEILVRESLRSKQVKIQFRIEGNSKKEIFQAYQPIVQLLHNLIINAYKAMKNIDGEKFILVEGNFYEDTCVIQVKDTGCGIPVENRLKIFNYGFTTTDGSGIGLFHAKAICEEIGGDIALSEDTEGFSTVFTLKFPQNGTKEDNNN